MDGAATVQAWRDLHNPEVGGRADAEGLLDLMLAAGFDDETAQREATKRGLKIMEMKHEATAK